MPLKVSEVREITLNVDDHRNLEANEAGMVTRNLECP
jgi:hypothetical protein